MCAHVHPLEVPQHLQLYTYLYQFVGPRWDVLAYISVGLDKLIYVKKLVLSPFEGLLLELAEPIWHVHPLEVSQHLQVDLRKMSILGDI